MHIKQRTQVDIRHPPAYYAELYREHDLLGGHVIKLGPGNDVAAREALAAWPGMLSYITLEIVLNLRADKLQVGGGINDTNAQEWLDAGASKVSSASATSRSL